MMLTGPKKDEKTLNALSILAAEDMAAKKAQIDADAGKISAEEANSIIRDFNVKFLALGGMRSFTRTEIRRQR